MPIYEYQCEECGEVKEVLHSYPELEKPSEETIKEITCHGRMVRIFSAPHVANSQGGVTVSESTLLAQKQEQRKVRSRAHFKNDVLPTIKNPGERRHFENKFKGTKTIDHEKMK